MSVAPRREAPAAGEPEGAGHSGLVIRVEQERPMPLHGGFGCGPRELLALVGPSGAGKTSMLRVLAGLMHPASGTVSVGGELWCDTGRGVFVAAQQRHVGLVFQNYALMPHLSAIDNVALALLHLPRAQRLARARQWLDHVHLSPAQQRRQPGALSGGQQQRVGVARALAREPRLLLLDEPFAAVDATSREGLYRLLADLRRELAVPIVLVTHDLGEARMLADRLVVMDAGRVLQEGEPNAIYRAPRNARVAELVGIHNRFHGLWLGPTGVAGRATLRWVLPGVENARQPMFDVRDKGRLRPGQELTWVLPSDGISVAAVADGRPGWFGATAVEARLLGEITLASFELDGLPGAVVKLLLSGPQRRLVQQGQAVALHLDAELVHVMPLRGH